MADNKIQCPSCGGPNTVLDSSTDQSCVFCGTGFVSQEVEDNTTKIKPENDKVFNWMVMAETAREGGDNEEAISYYNKILEEDSSHSASWFGKGTSIIWTSKLGDIKMPEALTYYKNAIKFSKGKEMKKSVSSELNDVVATFYPNVKGHFIEFKDVGNAVTEFFSRFQTLEAGLAFGLECNPDNEQLIDNGIYLVNDFSSSIGFSYVKIVKPEEIKVKYIKEKKRLNPDWEEKVDVKSAAGCFVATATMGDYNHPTVLQLRLFRDNYLLHKRWGQIFTKYYYKWGPYPASIIEKSVVLKKLSYFMIVKPLSTISYKIIDK